MKVLLLLVPLIFVSCGGSNVDLPKESTVAPVRVPTPPPAPDVSEVEERVADLAEEVSAARDEVKAAKAKVAEGVEESENLRALIEAEYESAELTAKTALENIRDAATRTAKKLTETVALLKVASEKLAIAREESVALSGEVSDLKVSLAVQTSRVLEFVEVANVANRRVESANAQKDTFRNELTESAARLEVMEIQLAKVKKQRAGLAVACILLVVICGGLVYVVIKF